MRFLHLADLHIGKKCGEYSLLEDQRHVLLQAMDLAKKERADAIVIAGDVFDSSVPTAEATELYDWLLTSLHALNLPVLIISGNHDSPERLHVGSSILKSSGIHIATKVEEAIVPITVDGVDFYLLPYFRPSDVNHAFGAEAKTFEGAMKEVLARMPLSPSRPSVLVTHQAILPLGAKIEASGSESSLDVDAGGSVGGTEVIDVNLFHGFAYLALGHIHKAQNVSHNSRYPGALLKYHVKEANAKRSFTMVDVGPAGVQISEHPVRFLRDLAVLRGTLSSLLSRSGHEGDFVLALLEDEQTVDSPFAQLKAKYPYCIGLDYVNVAKPLSEQAEYENIEEIDKADLFGRFYEQYAGKSLDEKETAFVKSLFEEGGASK